MTADEKLQLQYKILRKTRELRRDVLFIKYGEQWSDHDRDAGKFFDAPFQEEKALMEFLLAFADGDTRAINAVKEFA